MEHDSPQPPEELVAEGREWARRQLMSEQGDAMERHLQGLFASGIEIFRMHQHTILARIEKAGGVARIREVTFNGNGLNGVECNNGEIIYASDILQTSVLSQDIPVPEDFKATIQASEYWNAECVDGVPVVTQVKTPETEEKVTQAYKINMLYSGREIYHQGIEALTGFRPSQIDLTPGALIRCLDPEFYPTEIGIEELVTTRYISWQDEARRLFSLDAKIWQPSFEGRNVGHPLANMVFTAIRKVRGEDVQLHRSMFSYISDHGHVAHGVTIDETKAQLTRFYELLTYAHRAIVEGVPVTENVHPQIPTVTD